jgi:hypothetical protein
MIDNENNRTAETESYPEDSAMYQLMILDVAIRALISCVLDELKSLFMWVIVK